MRYAFRAKKAEDVANSILMAAKIVDNAVRPSPVFLDPPHRPINRPVTVVLMRNLELESFRSVSLLNKPR